MNLWLRSETELIIVAPLSKNCEISSIDLYYNTSRIRFIPIPEFNITDVRNVLKTIFLFPALVFNIVKGFIICDHIHLRCPGNVSLIGCFIQIFFPRKRKTAKYAGNWDWNSKQPWSYRLQQRILRNTFLSRNITVLVYGEWPDKTKNIKPFFTASYSQKDRLPISKKGFNDCIKIAFVGGLYSYKNPRLSLDVVKRLLDKGIKSTLTYCGDGPERQFLEHKVKEWGLSESVFFLGNVNADVVKSVLIESHFLVFISKSEGWPKVVAEAMWWGCLPITTRVSCVEQMLGNGERGDLVSENVDQTLSLIENYFSNPQSYFNKINKAINWSRDFTIEKFEAEIQKILA